MADKDFRKKELSLDKPGDYRLVDRVDTDMTENDVTTTEPGQTGYDIDEEKYRRFEQCNSAYQRHLTKTERGRGMYKQRELQLRIFAQEKENINKRLQEIEDEKERLRAKLSTLDERAEAYEVEHKEKAEQGKVDEEIRVAYEAYQQLKTDELVIGGVVVHR